MFFAARKVEPRRGTLAQFLSVSAILLASSGTLPAQSTAHTACNLDADGFCITESSRPVMVSPSTSPSGLHSNPSSVQQKRFNVDFQNGRLRIDAENLPLLEVLRAVSVRTGAEVQFPAGALREPVFVHLGPGKPRDVLNQLLKGAPFNYLILSADAGQPDQV